MATDTAFETLTIYLEYVQFPIVRFRPSPDPKPAQSPVHVIELTCVCVCVLGVCVCVRACVMACVCLSVCLCVCMYACMCMSVGLCLSVCACVYLQGRAIESPTELQYAHTHTRTHAQKFRTCRPAIAVTDNGHFTASAPGVRCGIWVGSGCCMCLCERLRVCDLLALLRLLLCLLREREREMLNVYAVFL